MTGPTATACYCDLFHLYASLILRDMTLSLDRQFRASTAVYPRTDSEKMRSSCRCYGVHDLGNPLLHVFVCILIATILLCSSPISEYLKIIVRKGTLIFLYTENSELKNIPTPQADRLDLAPPNSSGIVTGGLVGETCLHKI